MSETIVQGSAGQNYHSFGNVVANDNASLHLGDVINQYYTSSTSQKDAYTILCHSLAFERMDARLRNVALPLPATCEWLVHHDCFRQWADTAQIANHHGFLWIKGKPGSGKSTIMKETLSWAESNWPSDFILSYFFNARSPDVLEKSTLGLYRSLLHQLLCLDATIHDPFRTRFASKVHQSHGTGPVTVETWTVTEIQNFLIELFRPFVNRQAPAVDIFIDALDEGDVNDIRGLVRFLEQLTNRAAASTRRLRICLSSRHYPHITVKKALSLSLEDAVEHNQDINVYVQSELLSDCNLKVDDLRSRVRDRSNGVFLWVVLITHVLNKLYDEGDSLLAMSKKLDETPSDIFLVFGQILSQQLEGMEECGRMLRWVLFAQKPLSPLELCTATQHFCQIQDESEQLSTPQRDFNKYLLHYSRGLLELTKAVPVRVQFIHESVRNYLLGDESSISVQERSHPLMYSYLPSESHLVLADQCLQYILRVSDDGLDTRVVSELYPFLSYAASYWWRHIQMSRPEIETLNYQQTSIIIARRAVSLMTDRSKLALWLKFYDIDGRKERYAPLSTIFLHHNHPIHYATMLDASDIISTILSDGTDINTPSDHYEMTPLHIAAASGSENALQTLLLAGADVNAKNAPGDTALHLASVCGSSSVVQRLLEQGACANCRNNYGRTPLQLTQQRGYHHRLLAQQPSICQQSDEKQLYSILNLGYKSSILLPLRHDTDLNTLSIEDQGALVLLARDPAQMLERLCSMGIVFRKRNSRVIILHLAAREGHVQAVRALLDRGHDPNVFVSAVDEETPLHSAAMEGHTQVAEALLDGGANINALDNDGDNAYSIAESRGYADLLQMLKSRGGCAPPATKRNFRPLSPMPSMPWPPPKYDPLNDDMLSAEDVWDPDDAVLGTWEE